MKLTFSQKYRPDPELLALKEDLQEAQWELTLAYRRFNRAVDPELVESCVYQISAAKARCNYLIRTIKEREAAAEAQESCGKRTHRKARTMPPKAETACPTCGEEDVLWT